MVPSPGWFIYGFVRKEAVLTSQIEGTQATLIDLFEQEGKDGVSARQGDVQEVCNYLEALEYARGQIGSRDGLPISLRLLREAHRRLLKGARGAGKEPRQFRRSQNWIGGTRPGNAAFVPPPPSKVMECLSSLEKYIHGTESLDPLVRIALIHVQFETIHPFLDGNGRLGRLLIALLLEEWKIMHEPLLYISLYLKRHRAEYYARLSDVRRTGDWEGWISFFLEGVETSAEEATLTAEQLYRLVERDREKLLRRRGASVAAVALLQRLGDNPILNVARATRLLKTTKPTAAKAISALIGAGILKETSGKRRGRTFAYERYLNILKKGTELEGRR